MKARLLELGLWCSLAPWSRGHSQVLARATRPQPPQGRPGKPRRAPPPTRAPTPVTRTPLASPARPCGPVERFLSVSLPGGPYAPSAPDGGTDDYRCFLIDPHLTNDTFVTGAEVVPGQPAIVHHAILFRVEPSQVAAAKAHDAVTPGRGWTCFGNSAVPDGGASGVNALDSAPWLAAWAPAAGRAYSRAAPASALPPAARSCSRCTTTCLRSTRQPARTTPRSGCASHRGPRTCRRCTPMLLAAPVELPCTAAGERPALRPRSRAGRSADPVRPAGRTDGRRPAAAVRRRPGRARAPDRPSIATVRRRAAWSSVPSPGTCICSAARSRSP